MGAIFICPFLFPRYDTSLQDVCNDLANRWISWNHTKETPFSKQDLAAFTPGQKIEFLAILLDKEMYDLPKVKSLQDVYRFNGVRNCEIRFR
jgi:Leukotriene A4 hydrolase, C-terminal.